MTGKDKPPDGVGELRRRAEEIFREKAVSLPEDQANLSSEEIRRLLHELRVHQIELEMQNEELRGAQEELSASRERYFDLYDLAPIGYFTVSGTGLILEANLTVCNLLGVVRGAVVNRPISQFILKDDQDIYYLHRKFLFSSGKPQECELRMVKQDGTLFWTHLEAAAAKDAAGAPVSRIVMSDITGRKRAEDALRESEARFRIVADFTYDWEYWLGPDGRFKYVSPSVERITGRIVSEGAMAEAFLRLVVHPEDVEWVLDHLQKHLTCHGAGDLEFRIVRPGGEERWLAHVCQPVRDAQGQFLGMRGSNRDITQRKKAEKELDEAKETQFRTLIDNLPSKVFLKNRNSVYMVCNENYANDLGIKPGEIAGKTDYDFFPTHLAEKYRADDKRVMESGEIENLEDDYSTIGDFLKNDQKMIINTVKIPIRDNAGNVTGLLGFFWDITARRSAEELLRESENRYRNIFVSSRDAIMTIEPPFWKFTSGNPATMEMFKVKDEAEFMRCEPWQLSPELQPDGRSSVAKGKELIEKAVCEGAQFFEWVHKRMSGEVFFAEVLLSKVDLGGKASLQAVVRDITERKTAEMEIRRTEVLKISAESKSRFASMVSHELRSPLAIIQGGIDLITDGLCGEVTAEQKKILDMSQKGVERLGRLINNVLDFQKIQAGKMEYNIRDHDLRGTVQEAAESLKFLSAPKGLELRLEFGEHLPKIKFGKDSITQVLTNLVSNAIKFTSKGSVTISVQRENNEMHVEIRDTGPGIKHEDIRKLFQPFEQIDLEKGRSKGGTGLGLAISKEIILAHGGRIWAESEIGKDSYG